MCLHTKNYRPILVDCTGWIYVDFLSCSERAPTYLLFRHLLNEIQLNCFNLIGEKFKFPPDRSFRQVDYLQADLNDCQFKFANDQTINDLLDNVDHLREKHDYLHAFVRRLSADALKDQFKFVRLSLLKTVELEKIFFKKDPKILNLVNRLAGILKSNRTNSPQSPKLKLDEFLTKSFLRKKVFLLKVKAKGSVYLLANTQLNGKLRADLNVELVDIFQLNPVKKSLVVALVGRSLFYYNFLHADNYYLMIVDEKEVEQNKDQFKNLNSVTSPNARASSSGILFVNENYTILDQQTIIESVDNYDALFRRYENSLENKRTSQPDQRHEFVGRISGRLIEKRLQSSNIDSKQHHDSQFDQSVMDNFDILFSNRELKLLVQVNAGDEQLDSIVTIYFETRYAMHQLSILPGLEVTLSNLTRRGNNKIYKASTNLFAEYSQPFNFISHRLAPDTVQSQQPSQQRQTTKKKSTFDYLLSDLDFIYTSVYKMSDRDEDEDGNESDRVTMDEQTRAKQSADLRLKSLFNKSATSHLNFKSSGVITVLAQLQKINELTVRMYCTACNLFATYCNCSTKGASLDKYRVELHALFQIDDNSSLLKVNYTNFDFDLRSKESNLFEPISSLLFTLLRDYLSEIKMPNVPVYKQLSTNEQQSTNKTCETIMEAIREKQSFGLVRSNNLLRSMSESTMDSSDSSRSSLSDSVVSNGSDHLSLHILKSVYDFLAYCAIDKYYLFTIDLTQFVLNKSTSKFIRNKANYELVNLDEQNQSEQFKSIQFADCIKFTSIDSLNFENEK